MKLLYYFYSLLSATLATKTWWPSSDMTDSTNWGPVGFPKTCDIIILNETDGYTVDLSLPKEVAVKEIILPRNGVLRLSSATSANFAGSFDCPMGQGRSVSMVNVARGWLDPNSWIVPGQKWLPHNLRVPCAGEEVVFVRSDGISAILPPVIVPATSIEVNGDKMNMEQWSAYLQTENGYENFMGGEDVRKVEWPTDKGCQTNKTCHCGRDSITIRDYSYEEVSNEVLNEAICLYAGPRCESVEAPSCSNPIYPHGHCCGVCGALMVIQDATIDGISLDSIDSIAAEKSKAYGDRVDYHVGRLSNGNIQVVIISYYDDVSDSIGALNDIAEALPSGLHSRSGITMSYSGPSKDSSKFGRTIGLMALTLVGMVSFLLSIYYIYAVLPQKKWLASRRNFTFARFQNVVDEAEGDSVTLSTESYENLSCRANVEETSTRSESPVQQHKLKTEDGKELLPLKDCAAAGKDSESEENNPEELTNLIDIDIENDEDEEKAQSFEL